MPRKRTSKITAKRHSKIPPATKPMAATVEPVVAAGPAPTTPVVVVPKAVVATFVAVETKPDVEAKPAATKTAESAPIATTASSATVTAIQSLFSPDADTARDAATALGSLGDKTSVDPLLEVLNNAEGYFHSVVRAAAASSLGQIGDRRAVQPLLTAIFDPIAEVSSESIRALGVLGDEHAINPLIDVVQNLSGYFLPVARQAAIHALAKFGGERAATELRIVASSEWEEPAIRSAAQAGIARGAETAKA